MIMLLVTLSGEPSCYIADIILPEMHKKKSFYCTIISYKMCSEANACDSKLAHEITSRYLTLDHLQLYVNHLGCRTL